MEITPTATIKTPPETSETETQTPTRIQPLVSKPLSFTNGVLKRHHQVTVTYKECLKNHAASLGGHAVDGCGEFMPSPTTNPSNPTSLTCAACGCHRNFHRRDPDDTHAPPPPPPPPHHVIEYQPHHRHHPPPPPQPIPQTSSPNNSPSPPPISSSYYPSAPHMLLALSTAAGGVLSHPPQDNTTFTTPNSRKRFRTKFTQDQKIKMHEFAEKVGWKMQKKDEETITDFCNEIGVEKNVLKVWMHNNKSTLGKRDGNSFGNPNGNGDGNGDVNTNGTLYHHHHLTTTNDVDDNNDNINNSVNPSHQFHNSDSVVATNGSSSS